MQECYHLKLCESVPIHTNAQKIAPAQDTQQRLRHIWKKGLRDTKDNMTAKQMSFSTIIQVLFTKKLKNRYFRNISSVSLVFM